MKVSLGLVCGVTAACLAAYGQGPTSPRARSAQVIVQKSGGYLGIGGIEVTPERMKALNLKEERGVEVSRVMEDGPAAKAGIKEGDVVLEFNGTPVQGTSQFQRLVSETPIGRQVKLSVWRNGAAQTLTATIGENKGGFTSMLPDDRSWTVEVPQMRQLPNLPEFRMLTPEMLSGNQGLGIYGESLADAEQLAEFFGVPDGVLVRSVKKGSAADKAGIKAGDVITKIEDTHIANTPDITRTLRSMCGRKTTVTVTVVRNKKETPLSVTLDSGTTTRASLNIVNC